MKQIKYITARFFTALGILSILTVSTYTILHKNVLSQKTNGDLINKIGRQHMLSQRIAMLSNRLVNSQNKSTKDKLRNELIIAAGEMKENHKKLADADGKESLSNDLSEGLNKIYFNPPVLLDKQVHNYLAHTQALINSPGAELTGDNPHLTSIIDAATEKLLISMNTAANQFRAESEMDVLKTRKLITTLLIVTLITMILTGHLVFYPMKRRIQQEMTALQDLNETLEDRVHEKTKKLMDQKNNLDRSRETLKRALDDISALIQRVSSEKNLKIRFNNPYLGKCYEIKNCSSKECMFHGKEATRCWQTSGTICDGELQGTFAQKYSDCVECSVYKEASFDPVFQIGEQFNNMMHVVEQKNKELEEAHEELGKSRTQILQQEKMASVGQLAAGVAHEINNPIGFIHSNLNTLNKYVTRITDFINMATETVCSSDSSKARETLATTRKTLKLDYILKDVGSLITESLDGVDRVKKIVNNLKTFSRIDEAEFIYADINECIESTLNIVWNELKYNSTVTKDYGNLPPVKCYPQQLNQVFMNMFVNASHAIGKKGEIKIKTWNDSNNVNISISDNGCGIPEDKISRIFEPFFTTKEIGKGTGLGLSIAYDIIKKHGGEILVDTERDRGTTFKITIPLQGKDDSLKPLNVEMAIDHKEVADA